MRQVKRVRDLTVTQNRITISFHGCPHMVSLTKEHEVAKLATAEMDAQLSGTILEWPCTFCPDAPVEEVREEKTAIQLWKEAHEPEL